MLAWQGKRQKRNLSSIIYDGSSLIEASCRLREICTQCLCGINRTSVIKCSVVNSGSRRQDACIWAFCSPNADRHDSFGGQARRASSALSLAPLPVGGRYALRKYMYSSMFEGPWRSGISGPLNSASILPQLSGTPTGHSRLHLS